MVNLQNYVIVENEPNFNLSIKLVIPSGCGMSCPFCFNNLNRATAKHDVEEFKANFIASLRRIVMVAKSYNPKRTISLDITGNEPTFDKELFKDVLIEIKNIRTFFDSIVVTSNGMHVAELADYMKGIVDIVNISVHHYNPISRKNAFGLYNEGILSKEYYDTIVAALKKNDIKVSAVAVLYKKLETSFEVFIKNFVKWCKDRGFEDLRIRSNFYAKDGFFIDYLNDATFGGVPFVTKGLVTKKFTHEDFNITMLMGVESLITHVVGVEAVVDDDGKPYLDYGKEHTFMNEYVKHIYVTFP